jgi:hypothetical protein
VVSGARAVSAANPKRSNRGNQGKTFAHTQNNAGIRPLSPTIYSGLVSDSSRAAPTILTKRNSLQLSLMLSGLRRKYVRTKPNIYQCDKYLLVYSRKKKTTGRSGLSDEADQSENREFSVLP